MAKLLFKYATMNSGKTIDLLRTAYNYEENNEDDFINNRNRMRPVLK